MHGRLSIGDNVSIGPDCLLDLAAPVIFESCVDIGYGTTFITGTHDIGPESNRVGRPTNRAITIKSGAWVGAKAVILPGVTIGSGAVVSAGSLVSHDVEANTVVAGVPARVVRRLPKQAPGDNQHVKATAST